MDKKRQRHVTPEPMLEQLEPRLLLSVSLPGLHLVDPTVSRFDGQIIYLDIDGEENVTYNGPVTVENIDVPAFSAPGAFVGQEEAIIAQILDRLDETFVDSGVAFMTEKPASELPYSTIYVGGNDARFSEYGSFLGLAEQVDVGNQDPSDNAFVFSSILGESDAGPDAYSSTLAGVIAHEAGRLLGYANDSLASTAGPLESVAATYYSDYGTSRSHNITVESGRHYFQVDGIAANKNTEWYVNGSYTGSGENDWSGIFAIDPEYDYYFSSGTTEITAWVYDRYWNPEEYHTWNVTVGQPDLTQSYDYLNKTTVAPGDTLSVDVTVKNIGSASANSGYVYYYFQKGSRSYTDSYKVGSDPYGSLGINGTSDESFSYTVPSGASPGTWYFYYWIDATGTTSEISENNNRYYWTVTINVDNPPTASVTNCPNIYMAGVTQIFQVEYSDDIAIDVSTLDYSEMAAFIGIDNNTDGTPRTGYYRIDNPPGGRWDDADNGTYTLTMQANQVEDNAGQAVPSGTLDTFVVNIPVDNPPTASVTNCPNIYMAATARWPHSSALTTTLTVRLAPATTGSTIRQVAGGTTPTMAPTR